MMHLVAMYNCSIFQGSFVVTKTTKMCCWLNDDSMILFCVQVLGRDPQVKPFPASSLVIRSFRCWLKTRNQILRRLAQGQAPLSLRLMVSMQAPLQAPDIGRETMLTDIWETPEVLRGLLHLAGQSENQSAAVAAFLPQERSVDI